MVMERNKICESGDKFVHVVTVSPEPMCILATNQQFADLVHFSTNCNHFCVLSTQLFLWEISMSHVLLIEIWLCLTLEMVSVL